MKVRSLFTNKVIYIFVLITCFLEWNIEVVKSKESGTNKLCEVVPEANTYEIITQNTISQTELTIPSLWWRKQQLDPQGAIIINWQAYKKDRIIDLIVIGQQWNSLDYIKRYSIINDFGTIAREYQYNLRIISERKVCLATYNCQFDFNPDRCQIDFEFLGRSILEKGN
ncbi:MAG: hypothetical protein ACFBSE_21670 [Prochloraceae cyanobacterium]